jgi:hypothetical protein
VLIILSTIRWVYEPVTEAPTSVTKAPTATKKRGPKKTTKAPSPPAEEAPAAAAPSPPAEETPLEETLPAAVADPVTESPTSADGSVDPETSVSLRTDTY